jgi:Fic family protein
MTEGLERLNTLPLSLRLVRDLHERLMRDVRGQEKTPGQFRTDQNWIGVSGSSLQQATYVPPPPAELMACLSNWESFVYEDLRIPPIIRCALMHYQFEAIHPFLDGNGRVGRLLIVLFLCTAGHLPSPVLYLSPFFEQNRDEYYAHLRAVSETSRWNEWFEFFTRAVIVQSRDGLTRSHRMLRLHQDYRRELLLAKAPPSAQRLVDQLFETPATTAAMAADRLSLTIMSATRAIQVLVKFGILEEVTGRRRDRVYVAPGLVEAIEADTGVQDLAGALASPLL